MLVQVLTKGELSSKLKPVNKISHHLYGSQTIPTDKLGAGWRSSIPLDLTQLAADRWLSEGCNGFHGFTVRQAVYAGNCSAL